jgi:hypothetical protein
MLAFTALAPILLIATPASTSQAEAAPPPDSARERNVDEVVCRTEPVIGSRAKKRRVCLTRRQWANVANDGNGLARRVVEDHRAGMIGN